jgi:hypothetical protein
VLSGLTGRVIDVALVLLDESVSSVADKVAADEAVLFVLGIMVV